MDVLHDLMDQTVWVGRRYLYQLQSVHSTLARDDSKTLPKLQRWFGSTRP